MSWDNLTERGPIDRVFVSQTETWEVHYFVDHYLQTNNYDVTDSNRKIVRDAMHAYPGRAPVKRDELTTWLNQRFKK